MLFKNCIDVLSMNYFFIIKYIFIDIFFNLQFINIFIDVLSMNLYIF